MLLPLRRLHHFFDAGALRLTEDIRSCLVTRSSRWASVGFGGFATAGLDLAFCDACAFSPPACRMETGRLHLVAVSIVAADMDVELRWVRGVVIDARTTQSPAICEASHVTGHGPQPSAHDHTNASFAAEVQSVFDARAGRKIMRPVKNQHRAPATETCWFCNALPLSPDNLES